MLRDEIHVRAFRLGLLSLRRDFLRELRGDYVTKKHKCDILNSWLDEMDTLLVKAGELLNMPSKNGNKVIQEWKGFRDFKLTAEQLEGFGSFDTDDDDLMDLVQTTLVEGYKLTLTYSGQSDTYNCALTCNAEKHANQGYTMSAFAPSAYTALKLLMYKHHVLLESDWSKIPAPQRGGLG